MKTTNYFSSVTSFQQPGRNGVNVLDHVLVPEEEFVPSNMGVMV